MSLENQLLLMFSAFGALNGFVVSAYVYISSKQQIARQFLAFMLLMISIRIFKSVLFYFNADMDKVILQIGLSACFLIGPLLYFYAMATLSRATGQAFSWRAHLATMLTLVVCIGLAFPYSANAELWGNSFYKIINFAWFFYIALSLFRLRLYLLALFDKKKEKLAEDEILLVCVLLGNILIWLAYFTASYTSYIVGAFSFSFIFLLSSLLIFFKFKTAKYGAHKIDNAEAQQKLAKLELLMLEQMLFKNANITMPQVAKRLSMSSPRFSQLLNEKLNKSFSVYINELRITHARKLLIEQPSKKIDELAEQCGFNSSSTFYSVFKKHTGLTPVKYKEEQATK